MMDSRIMVEKALNPEKIARIKERLAEFELDIQKDIETMTELKELN